MTLYQNLLLGVLNKELSVKKIIFISVLLIGIIGFMETFASVYYYLRFDKQKREQLELLLGLRTFDEHITLRYAPHPYLNYVFNPKYQLPDGDRPYNSKGFRAPEWPTTKEPETIRIVAVGGSTTYGMFFKDGKNTWPALLERALEDKFHSEFEVLNLGIPGYTSHEIIGVLAMLAPALSPEIILIHIGGNDAFAAAYPDEGGPDNTSFRYSWYFTPLPELLTVMMRKIFLIRLLGITFIPLVKGALPGDSIAAMQYPHPPDQEVIVNSQTATGKYFQQNLKTLISLSKNIDAIPVLFTHPLHPKWEYPKETFYKVVIAAHKRNNKIIMEVGARHDVLVVDLYSHMQDARFFSDALHASAEGMKKKTVLIADAIEATARALEQRNRQSPQSHSHFYETEDAKQ